MTMRRSTSVVLVLLAVGLTGCDSAAQPSPASSATTSTDSPVPSGSGSPPEAFTLTASTDICAAFDAAAMGALSVTTPTRSPVPGDPQPICIFPGAAQGDGPVGIQAEPDQTLDSWLQFSTNVIRLEVAGRPAASAQVGDLPCKLGVELGGGVLSLSQSGTADDCSYLLPAAEYAVAGVLASG